MSVDFESEFPSHPFENLSNEINFATLLGDYSAMSQAFPYVINGAQGKIIFDLMEETKLPTRDIEATSVVSTFLSWDEYGGLYPTISHGLKALPKLLEAKWFHSNLLLDDCSNLFGEEFKPQYSEITKKYLKDLHDGFGDVDPVRRIAYMVSFESHAERMITALWNSLDNAFEVDKNELKYFRSHVGGDDPAEAYHVEMTDRLIGDSIPEDRREEFHVAVKEAYRLHIDWCDGLVKLAA